MPTNTARWRWRWKLQPGRASPAAAQRQMRPAEKSPIPASRGLRGPGCRRTLAMPEWRSWASCHPLGFEVVPEDHRVVGRGGSDLSSPPDAQATGLSRFSPRRGPPRSGRGLRGSGYPAPIRAPCPASVRSHDIMRADPSPGGSSQPSSGETEVGWLLEEDRRRRPGRNSSLLCGWSVGSHRRLAPELRGGRSESSPRQTSLVMPR